MKPIYIFRHLACEGPGYFAETLRWRALPFEVIAIDQGAAVPVDPNDASALVFMGGSMSVNDPLSWLAAEVQLIRHAYAIGMPVLGHCLGGQLIAKALGAEVRPNAVKEIGWHAVEQTAGAGEWLAGLPPHFEVFHWHGETFSLPAGATPLLRSMFCYQQAFSLVNALALQSQIEMTSKKKQKKEELGGDELQPSSSVQSAHAMLERLPQRVAALQQIADIIYDRWLGLVAAYTHRRAD